MPLVLSVLSGPLAGREFAFDEKDTTRVRIGRSAACEVRWPEEEPIVGREHFEMQYQAGVWKFVLNPVHRVFVSTNSAYKDAYQHMPLADEASIRLGTSDGPGLLLRFVPASSNQVKTLAQGVAVDDHGLIERARAHIRLVVLTVASLAALGGYFLGSLRSEVREIKSAIAIARVDIDEQKRRQEELDRNLKAVAEKTDFSRVFAQSRSSIFLVGIVRTGAEFKSAATAWVVRLKDGQKALATNAHVGDAYKEATENGWRMIARSPVFDDHQQVREYAIRGLLEHPGYGEFKKATENLQRQVEEGNVRDVGTVPGYDIAILLPESADELPEPLTIANRNEIASLHPGETLGFQGYPSANIQSLNPARPRPIVQKGIATSMTSFFLMPAGSEAQLILHNLPVTGGASGGPIFNAAGNVVAILSAGNVTPSDDRLIPSAALVNFAQRVDLLHELLDGTAGDRMATYRSSWSDTVAKLGRTPDEFFAARLASFKEENSRAKSVGRKNGTIETASPAFLGHLAAMIELDLEAGYRYRVLTKSPDKGAKLSMFLPDQARGAYLDLIESGAAVAELEFDSPKSGKSLLAIVSAAKTPDQKPNLTPVKFDLAVWRAKN